MKGERPGHVLLVLAGVSNKYHIPHMQLSVNQGDHLLPLVSIPGGGSTVNNPTTTSHRENIVFCMRGLVILILAINVRRSTAKGQNSVLDSIRYLCNKLIKTHWYYSWGRHSFSTKIRNLKDSQELETSSSSSLHVKDLGNNIELAND